MTQCLYCAEEVDFGSVFCPVCANAIPDQYWDALTALHVEVVLDQLKTPLPSAIPTEPVMLCCGNRHSQCRCSQPLSENLILEYTADQTWHPYKSNALCHSCLFAYSIDCSGMRAFVRQYELNNDPALPADEVIDTCKEYEYDNYSFVPAEAEREGPSLFHEEESK